MESIEIVQYFAEFGAIGLFCMFLLYLHKKGESRIESMQKEHNNQLGAIQDSHQKHIDGLRSRYDSIIEQYRNDREKAIQSAIQEREKLHTLLIQKLEHLGASFDLFAKQLDTISDQIDHATGALRELSIESKARALAKRVN